MLGVSRAWCRLAAHMQVRRFHRRFLLGASCTDLLKSAILPSISTGLRSAPPKVNTEMPTHVYSKHNKTCWAREVSCELFTVPRLSYDLALPLSSDVSRLQTWQHHVQCVLGVHPDKMPIHVLQSLFARKGMRTESS